MKNGVRQVRPGAIGEGKILQPVALAGERGKVCCPKREVVAGSGPHLTKETQTLLRFRLRAAAFILLIGFAAFLVRHVAGVLAGEPLSTVLLVFHVLVVLVLGLSAAPLCRHCTFSMRKLRVSEMIIFGLPTVFFLMLQHRVTLED